MQGVGFRPFVYSLAGRLGLAGFVGNDEAGVFCEAEGRPEALERFVAALRRDAPPPAAVERVITTARNPVGQAGFSIVPSVAGPGRATPVPADVATCAACLAEMADPTDRRYRYPFVNCTHCGPRFTIVGDVPYDRSATTMAAFPMCDDCRREYHDPTDRRFHAQPVCCPACGPVLRLLDGDGRPVPGPPVEAAAAWLSRGGVVAVKGLGGYHLAVVADDQAAVAALRASKHREDKAFAVMVADPEEAARLCHLEPADVSLLTSPARPIVVAPRRAATGVAPAVAPASRWLGLMLPYSGLHHLLLSALGRPVVLTSGNVSDEPIAYRDDDARSRLTGLACGFLVHDRAIHVRADDSVLRSFRGRPLLLRRSRGYAPEPLRLAEALRRPVLGAGAELKSTFCLARGDRAYISHHIGDLEHPETWAAYREGVDHYRRLFGIRPEVVAHDLHPEYLSTKYALDLDGVDLVAVQHHHAHVAACLADNGRTGPVIGVAFDGLGLGPDATLWGGEFLIADLAGYRRVGHLAPVAMPGGTAAIHQPWRMAAAWTHQAFCGDPPPLAVGARHGPGWYRVAELAASGVASPLTSSAGRLFDAVAAMVGVRDRVNYEGQAALELEQLAVPGLTEGYPAALSGTDPVVLEAGDLIRAVAADLAGGVDPGVISARFHHGLAAATAEMCGRLRQASGLSIVALSGGVFQNAVLLEATVGRLEAQGFEVLVHSRVPPNDGGIALGQVAVAGAADRQPA